MEARFSAEQEPVGLECGPLSAVVQGMEVYEIGDPSLVRVEKEREDDAIEVAAEYSQSRILDDMMLEDGELRHLCVHMHVQDLFGCGKREGLENLLQIGGRAAQDVRVAPIEKFEQVLLVEVLCEQLRDGEHSLYISEDRRTGVGRDHYGHRTAADNASWVNGGWASRQRGPWNRSSLSSQKLGALGKMSERRGIQLPQSLRDEIDAKDNGSYPSPRANFS